MNGTEPFAQPLKVAELLAGLEAPWWIAGGWALDLFLGRLTRPHNDGDVAVLRADQEHVRRYFAGWQLLTAVPHMHGRLVSWAEGQWLELPVHEIHARNPHTVPPALEILLNESADRNWLFRRNPLVTRPLALIGRRSPLGMPYLSPEIVLLYKAPIFAPKDDVDFHAVLPALDDEQRSWLCHALEPTCPITSGWLRVSGRETMRSLGGYVMGGYVTGRAHAGTMRTGTS